MKTPTNPYEDYLKGEFLDEYNPIGLFKNVISSSIDEAIDMKEFISRKHVDNKYVTNSDCINWLLGEPNLLIGLEDSQEMDSNLNEKVLSQILNQYNSVKHELFKLQVMLKEYQIKDNQCSPKILSEVNKWVEDVTDRIDSFAIEKKMCTMC